ncbi:MAG: hypothetical protein M0P01_09670 [Treponema sp.]|nr:hypothetical protein [Treponema sp.]
MNDKTLTDAKLRMMLETEKELLSKLKEAERYRYFLGRMQYIRYEGGKENLLEADCSGSVCMALLLATDCSIRVTADTLYRKYFTKRNPVKDDISALADFWNDISKQNDERFSGRVLKRLAG